MKDRAAVKSLFQAHARTMNVSNIQPNGKPYQFTCTMNFIPQTACMLVRSSDFWAKRLHLQKHTVTMFVVWIHDSCLPFSVMCLKDGKVYDPYACAVDTSKRTKKTSKAFLGKLLCGVQEAFDILEKMPHPSKRRYEILLNEYNHREHARPLKVGLSKKELQRANASSQGEDASHHKAS